jgi:hypothetical protein
MSINLSNRGSLKKVLPVVVIAAAMLAVAGYVCFSAIQASAATPAQYGLKEGMTISAVGSNDPDVYIINDAGYKRLFINPIIFNMYGQLGGFADVHSVSAAVRDAFPTSGLFRNCEANTQAVYGLEVTGEDTGTLHWVNVTGDQAVAQDPNFFQKVFCINNNEFNWYTNNGTNFGANYSSISQIPNYSRQPGPTPTGTPIPTVGPLSVSLAYDNPPSGTLIETQAAADLLHVTLTGYSTVTSVILNRLGVSSDTTLTNVYLYNGNQRLTDAAAVSSGKITFSDTSGLFTVNGSMTISVKADIADSTAGQTVGVQLASINGNAVTISGNLFSMATNPTDLATVAVAAPTPSATTTLDPQKDYTMWQSTVTIGNHDVLLKSFQLRVIGSVLPGDLQNFRLYVDGLQVGSAIAQTDSNGYLVFDLGAGLTLKTGGRVIRLVGDVINGSNRSFIVSLRQKPDISAIDTQYGVGVLPSGTFPATAPTQTLGTEVQAINAGSLSMTKTADSASGNVIAGATGVSLVSYKFEAYGEAMKVESLRANFAQGSVTTTLSSLRNAAIYVDGAQVGSVQSLCSNIVASTASCSAYASSGAANTLFNLGSSLIVTPGTPRIVEVRADIYDNTGTNNATSGTTITAAIVANTSNIQKMTSLGYTSNTAPSTGNTLTIKTGTFAAAKYTGYANQSVVVPKSQFKIGQWTLTAASSEDVNVTTLNLDMLASPGFTAAITTNVFLKVYNSAGTLVYTSPPKSTISSTASNSYSVNFTIPKTQTWQIEAYANIGTGPTSDAATFNLGASGTTTGSSTSVTAADAAGQTITSANGSLALANGASPASSMVQGGTTKTVYVFTLQPQYDDFYLDEASFNLFSVVASSTGAVTMAYLYDTTSSPVLLGSSPITSTSSGSMDFSGLNYALPQNGLTKTLSVNVLMSQVGVSANDTAGNVTVRLSHLKYRDSNGNITTSVVDPTSYTGSQMRLVKAYPTFANVGLPTTQLAPGTQTLFKTQVTAVGGAVAWRKVVFTISVTATPTITNSTFQLFENGVDITTQASTSFLSGDHFATASANFNVANASGATGTLAFQFTTDRVISGTTTLELRGTVGGTNTAGNSITTRIANPNGSTFVDAAPVATLSPDASWGSDINPSFLWSDASSPTHSAITSDWMGDGLLTGLGQSQSLQE